MLEVGQMVMVRDGYIKQDYHVPPAKIVSVKQCPVLLSKEYLLEFENGVREWFGHYSLKVQ